MTSPAESASARRMLWVVAIVTVLPLLAAKHLPFTDLPEHVAVVSSLVHRADPSFHVQEHYVFAFPRSQYFLLPRRCGVRARASRPGDRDAPLAGAA